MNIFITVDTMLQANLNVLHMLNILDNYALTKPEMLDSSNNQYIKPFTATACFVLIITKE